MYCRQTEVTPDPVHSVPQSGIISGLPVIRELRCRTDKMGRMFRLMIHRMIPLLLVFWAFSTLRGQPMAMQDIAKLTARSPIIVVGEVQTIERLGDGKIITTYQTYPASRMAAIVQVDEVLKGEVPSRKIRIEYLQGDSLRCTGPNSNLLLEKTYRMLFLKADEGKYIFTAPVQSWMPMSRDRAVLPQAPGADVYSRVLQHLAETLSSKNATAQDQYDAITALESERSPAVAEIFRSVLNGPTATAGSYLRLQLMSVLIGRFNDTTYLPELTKAFFAPQDPKHPTYRGDLIGAVQDLKPSKARPLLIRALKLPDAWDRASAAMVLKQFPSSATINALLDAVDDPDRVAQFQIMEALSHLLDPYHLRWIPPLKSNPQDPAWKACLEHWKQVASVRKATHSIGAQ